MTRKQTIFFSLVIFLAGALWGLGRLRFASGYFGGTYNQMARTLNRLPGLSLKIIETRGSGENISLIEKGQADLGFAQLDVLIHEAIANRKVKKNVKILLPIYREEVHILAKKNIQKISDLKGTKVNIGTLGSGTYATASTILKKLGLYDSIQKDTSPSKSAVSKLKNGSLDAVILIGGAPISFLAKESKNANFHLLSFTAGELRAFVRRGGAYSRIKIRANMYPWQSKKVTTLAVESALIGSANLSSSAVKTIINTIVQNEVELIMSHEKWTDLDIGFIKKTARRKKIYFHPAALKVIQTLKEEL
ncbi:MAG: TAXI family TRAP transporter solute-binding subunit [Candidatus Hydrogenedentota bacterium]|nr:MAG: TAXI family TRAP transporter solute-binding subunit [Candidatus Hydrogenedentota bacterium]